MDMDEEEEDMEADAAAAAEEEEEEDVEPEVTASIEDKSTCVEFRPSRLQSECLLFVFVFVLFWKGDTRQRCKLPWKQKLCKDFHLQASCCLFC